MKTIAAYLLAALGGKASPSEGDITKILSSGAQRAGERRGGRAWAWGRAAAGAQRSR